ncbi:MAG: antitermination protein NusG [Candidatus Thiodiazotropha sp.]|jgi:hypothetical protein
MFSKILLTLAVIGVVWLVIRNRQRIAKVVVADNPTPAIQKQPNQVIKWVGYGLLGLMLSGSALYFAIQLQDSYRLVTVRVIDTQSGRSVSYTAQRGNVADRHFETLDGREVSVADSERIELEPAPAGGLR